MVSTDMDDSILDSRVDLRVPSQQQNATRRREYELNEIPSLDHNPLACRGGVIPVPKADACPQSNDVQTTVEVVGNIRSESNNEDNQFNYSPSWSPYLPIADPSREILELPHGREESQPGHRCSQQDTLALDSMTSRPPSGSSTTISISPRLSAIGSNDSVCELSPAVSPNREENLPPKPCNGHRSEMLNHTIPDLNNSTTGQGACVKKSPLNHQLDEPRDTHRVAYPIPSPTSLDRNYLPDSFVNLILHWTNLAVSEI
jgi:hypothetical protein